MNVREVRANFEKYAKSVEFSTIAHRSYVPPPIHLLLISKKCYIFNGVYFSFTVTSVITELCILCILADKNTICFFALVIHSWSIKTYVCNLTLPILSEQNFGSQSRGNCHQPYHPMRIVLHFQTPNSVCVPVWGGADGKIIDIIKVSGGTSARVSMREA